MTSDPQACFWSLQRKSRSWLPLLPHFFTSLIHFFHSYSLNPFSTNISGSAGRWMLSISSPFLYQQLEFKLPSTNTTTQIVQSLILPQVRMGFCRSNTELLTLESLANPIEMLESCSCFYLASEACPLRKLSDIRFFLLSSKQPSPLHFYLDL